MKAIAEIFFHPARRLLAPVLLGLFLAAGLLILASGTVLQAVAEPPPPIHSGLLLVGLDPELPEENVQRLFQEEGLLVVRRWPEFGLAAVRPAGAPGSRTTGAALAAARAHLRNRPDVRYAEYDGVIQAAIAPSAVGENGFRFDRDGTSAVQPSTPLDHWSSTFGPLSFSDLQDPIPDTWAPTLGETPPNDPRYAEQWGLARINAPVAWDIIQADRRLVIALIDSGYDVNHEDLDPGSRWVNEMERIGLPGEDDDGNGLVDDIFGWDWVEQDNVTNDPFGHGTHVGGILTALTNNGVGVASVGRSLTIMPLRVLDERGSGFISYLVDALAYARRKGARIVNLSLVLRFDSPAIQDAVRSYASTGGLLIAATGNYGNQVYWPAAYTETLAVAATTEDDQRAPFSNPGPQTDVAAPGARILSTYRDNSYYVNDGTSMAAPHVTALAALIWSLRPDLTSSQVADIIRKTAADVNEDVYPGADDFLGAGRIDAGAALLAASQGVSMSLDFLEGAYISVDQHLRIPAELRAPFGLTDTQPISGGVIHYELTGPTGTMLQGDSFAVLARSGRLVTGETGQAIIDFITPAQAGHYQLHVQHGSQERTLHIALQDGPLVLSTQAQTSELTVGDNQTLLVVEAQTNGSGPITAPLPIELETSLGYFENGMSREVAVMRGGRFTATFHAGTIAGIANITVTAANQTLRSFITVRPGEPERLIGPDRVYAIGPRDATTHLQFLLTDRYGNPIWEARQVHFYALRGRFAPDTSLAHLGTVETDLTLPAWIRNPERFWVTVPGTFIVFSGDAYLMRHRYWFPFLPGGGTPGSSNVGG